MQRFPWLPHSAAIHLQASRDFLLCRTWGRRLFLFLCLFFWAGRLRFIPGSFRHVNQMNSPKIHVHWKDRCGHIQRGSTSLCWAVGEAWHSSAPNLTFPHGLNLDIVNLCFSVIICCSTTRAFLPLAAFPLLSPLGQSGAGTTAFLSYSPLTATPALFSAVLLPLLWLDSDLTPSPHGINKLLTPQSLLSHEHDPFTGSPACIPLLHFMNLDSFLWKSFDSFSSCSSLLYLPTPCRYIIFCFWTYLAP